MSASQNHTVPRKQTPENGHRLSRAAAGSSLQPGWALASPWVGVSVEWPQGIRHWSGASPFLPARPQAQRATDGFDS